MTQVTVEPMQGESYVVRPNQFSWGVITINEATGLFMAYTDYGNFSYHWPAPGDKGLKHFLGTIEFDYAMGKLSANRGDRFDADVGIHNLRKRIKEERRDGVIERVTARCAWLEVDDIEAEALGENSQLFYDRIWRSSHILDAIGHDDWHRNINGRVKCPQCVGFWNNIFIPFVASYMPDHKLKPVSTEALI
ncbi:MAG TPA: hypothetical protein PLX33_09820 [Alphaproteobacteria bacterium]|nr:hypothetical protein [Alphaproteobacteria bacterium]